jgi:hypothetical protein
MKLTADQRRALALLAGSPRGTPEGLMLAHGFSIEMVAELVRAGLATAEPESVRSGGKVIEVTRVRITGAGRDAL